MGLPHVRSLIVVEKTSEPKSASQSKPYERTLSCSVISPPALAEFFAGLIREDRGGRAIRNHQVPDALFFKKDKTRSKNQNLDGGLAVLRCAPIALKSRLASSKSWPAIRELASLNPGVPCQWIFNNGAK